MCLAHFNSKNMHAPACCWLRLPGNSISISSVKSDVWLILRWWNSIFVGSLTFHLTTAFLCEVWPSPRDLTVKAMLKFGGTTIYIFRLHQRIGYHAPGAHNKADCWGNLPLRTGYPICADGGNWEGNNLDISEPLPTAGPQLHC